MLVFVLLQFMSRPDQAFPSEEKGISKVQNIVLRHLYLLLGYNSTEKFFHQTPDVLRSSTVYNVFMANLPQLLDQNSLMGFTMLPIVMQVLLYSPNPNSNALTNTEAMQNASYTYSLWYLEPHVRRNWLMSVLVILYKYQYTQLPFSQNVNSLIRIVLNSLESQFHMCKRIPATVVMDTMGMASRSRDVSLPSLGPDSDKMQETPPTSPIFKAEASNANNENNLPRPKSGLSTKGRKYADSLDADDTESELVAIPESDFSDSTLHGGSSAPGSFDDPLHFDEICAPLKPEIIKNRATAMVTTANLATAHVALTTLATAERKEETIVRKTHKTTTMTKNGDNVQKTTTLETTIIKTEPKDMQISPSVSEKAVTIPPANVHRALAISQKQEDEEKHAPEPQILSWVEQKISSPIPRPLGRQKRIIEASITPISSPNSVTDQHSPNGANDKMKRGLQSFDSPESPLSKMNVMSPPSSDNMDALMSPKSVQQLEIPMQERLLPIGPPGKDNIANLAERVREALSIPNISHLKQESLEISESSAKDESLAQQGTPRSSSPRRLMKQTALVDSPPAQNTDQVQDLHASLLKAVGHEPKDKATKPEQLRPQRQRLRKAGPFVIDSIQIPDARLKFAGSWQPSNFKPEESEHEEESNPTTANNENRTNSHSNRVGEDTIVDRCPDCGAAKEEYGDEEIGILIIILGTFIHREPQLAAPFMPEILTIVSKFASQPTFPWQYESSTHLPGGSQSVAHQFIRCVLHQLAPNGVFVQIFHTQASGELIADNCRAKNRLIHCHVSSSAAERRKLFKSIAKALLDFNEMSPASPIHLLVESLNSKKTLPTDTLPNTIRNMAEYMHLVLPDTVNYGPWAAALQSLETFFRRLIMVLPHFDEADHLIEVMHHTLRIQMTASKPLLEPFCKILSYLIQHFPIKYKALHELCCMGRVFGRERDRQQLCRQVVFEVVQALKLKTVIPDHNLLLIIGFVLHDAGGALPPDTVPGLPFHAPVNGNGSAECMRQYLNEVMDFLADFHTLGKIKNFKSTNGSGLGDDTLGGVLKGAVAQYLALEMSRGNSRDNKAVARSLPWLYNAPSTLQQGPKEFTECVCHMRLLSWLLMGSLTHSALLFRKGGNIGQHAAAVHSHIQFQGQQVSQPIPQEASCHIADHIQVIFAGFAEQSKTSVQHMSSLFHAFNLCQLWTLYLEQVSFSSPPSSEAHNITLAILLEFWGKVTPCILQLVTHSKVLSEMVNLHFVSLLESLRETKSTILAKLLPIWSPVFSSCSQISGTSQMRLQACRDLNPLPSESEPFNADALLKWLHGLQFKMGQIELQTSTVTQFYSI